MISAEFCPCFPQTPLSILLDIQDPAACQTQLSIPSRSRDLAPAPCSASCTGTENLLSMPPLNGTLVPPVFAQHPVPGVGTQLSIPSRSGHPASLHIPFSTPPQSGDPASPDPAHLSLEPGPCSPSSPGPGHSAFILPDPGSASFLGASTWERGPCSPS